MKKSIILIMVIAIMMSFAACSQSAASSSIAQVPSVADASNAVSSEAVQGAEDEILDIKIVATSVSVVDILDELGVVPVGIPATQYELPESVSGATSIGQPMSPDMEIIKSLEPDLVISVKALEPSLSETFNSLGIEASFLDFNSSTGLVESISTLGELTGAKNKAAELVKEIEDKVTEVSEASANIEKKSVLIIFGVGDSFQVATENAYVGDLVKLVGGENIITGQEGSFIPVDMEYLADKNPDYILLMTHANPEESKQALYNEIETNPAWDSFDAVKNDNIVALDSNKFGMSANLKITDGLDELAEILYGGN